MCISRDSLYSRTRTSRSACGTLIELYTFSRNATELWVKVGDGAMR
jgi:hypothetical protein